MVNVGRRRSCLARISQVSGYLDGFTAPASGDCCPLIIQQESNGHQEGGYFRRSALNSMLSDNSLGGKIFVLAARSTDPLT